MESEFSEELLQDLTEGQCVVLELFAGGFETYTVNEIAKETRFSKRTVSRALAKLVAMGVVERLEAAKKGRGYSNLYRLVQD